MRRVQIPWFNRLPGISTRKCDGRCIPPPPELLKLARINARFSVRIDETVADAKSYPSVQPAAAPPRLILKTTTFHARRIGPTLTPDRSRVLMRPFRPTTDDISRRIVARVMAMPEKEVTRSLDEVLGEFSNRHERVEDIFRKHFELVSLHLAPGAPPSSERQMLIGAYSTHEYSPESAALFNPSIVPHPDQSGLPKGAQRFILSLRATGEGHISSITFRVGVVSVRHRIAISKFMAGCRQAINPNIKIIGCSGLVLD